MTLMLDTSPLMLFQDCGCAGGTAAAATWPGCEDDGEDAEDDGACWDGGD